MGLIDQARIDTRRIVECSSEFGVPITLTSPGGTVANLTGLHTKHHMSLDTDGIQVNTKNSHISFSEDSLNGYPIRNSDGEVNLKNHRVSVSDSTGGVKEYVIQEWFPDETIGLIVCILGDYGSN